MKKSPLDRNMQICSFAIHENEEKTRPEFEIQESLGLQEDQKKI